MLTITPSLVKSYARDSFYLNANVAAATHGETVQEVLGAGDASQPYQSFNLRQPPLTYVSEANASGAESTLQVRVNDLLWHEVPTLYERGPRERVYVTRTDNDGKTTAQFGNGITGARLPSGQNNVRALYRKGIGIEGLVKAGQLSLLLTRPLGVKSATNPLDATGAQDPEQLDDARRNAPLTVLTLDRTVSLQDYEDFARAFAGLAKALATWTWDGQSRGVFVTVAGPAGAAVPSDSATHQHLLAAMQAAGDPFVRLRVKSYRPAYFRVAGTVKVDPDFETDKVHAAVEQELRTKFSFEIRAFGQPVMLSEVIAVVQAVPGVVALDADKLYRSDAGTAALEQRLLAALPAALSNGDAAAAELLMLDPAPLDNLGVMT
jgi:predicted phage baseplate assembly protein